MKNLIFLCIASAVVILTILDLNMGPVIKEDVSVNSWYDESCQKYVDLHKYNKDKSVTELSSLNVGVSTEDDKEDWLNLLNEGKKICYRKKAMIGIGRGQIDSLFLIISKHNFSHEKIEKNEQKMITPYDIYYSLLNIVENHNYNNSSNIFSDLKAQKRNCDTYSDWNNKDNCKCHLN